MEVKSERLSLIRFKKELLSSQVMSWFENANLMKYYTNSKKPITKEVLLSSVEEGAIRGVNFTYFIVYNRTQKLIGTIKIGPINIAHKISDLVALVGEKVEGEKGIGTEAIKLGINLAFDVHDIRKLYGGMYASNVASIKAYTRAGWIVEGLLKGHYIENGDNVDRILVGCFNPQYFEEQEIKKAKYEPWYEKNS